MSSIGSQQPAPLPPPSHNTAVEEEAGHEAVLEEQGAEGTGKGKKTKKSKKTGKAGSSSSDSSGKAAGAGSDDKCTCKEIEDTKFFPKPKPIHGSPMAKVQENCGDGNKWFNPSYLVALTDAVTALIDSMKSDRIASMEMTIKGYDYALETAENTAKHIMDSAETQAKIHEANAKSHMTQAIMAGVTIGVMALGTGVMARKVYGGPKVRIGMKGPRIQKMEGRLAKHDAGNTKISNAKVKVDNAQHNASRPGIRSNPQTNAKAQADLKGANQGLRNAKGNAFSDRMNIKSGALFKNNMAFMAMQQVSTLVTSIVDMDKEMKVAALTRLKGIQDKRQEMARHSQKIAQGIIDQGQKLGKKVEELLQQAFQQMNKWVDEYFRAFNISSRG